MRNLIPIVFISFIALFIVSCKGKDGSTTASEENNSELVSESDSKGQVYVIVPSSSKIYWEGTKPAVATKHTGTVNIKEGTLTVQNGLVTGGTVIIDMTSIVDTDLEGEGKQKLEAHLKGTAPGKEDDFFNVSEYPIGKFEITNTSPLEGDAEGNTMVHGNLTLKEITKPASFKANINIGNGSLNATTPFFKIDRTEYDIKVLSKKFFDNLQDGFVDDQIGLKIELRADAGKDI